MRTRTGTVVATAILVGTGLASLGLASVALVVAGSPTGPAAPTGTVTGSYTRIGGPTGSRSAPVKGTVSFASQAGPTISFSADRTGRFGGQLPTGRYAVVVKSSRAGASRYSCTAPKVAQVQTGQTMRIAVVCRVS